MTPALQTGATTLALQTGATTQALQTSAGEAVTFWVLAPVAVLAALGLLITKKAVHSALLLALTMMCLAVLYLASEAPFLGVVQVVVYTGAVMMLFLFVLMLVGVDASDSLVETLRGQRVAGVLAALGFGLLLILALGGSRFPVGGTAGSGGLAVANAPGNVEAVAQLIFTRYVFVFEVTSALLITAALAGMVLAHRERQAPAPSQRERAEARFRSLEAGASGPPLPAPGVYARHNAVDTPALLPDGSPSALSIPRALDVRGDVRSPAELTDDVPAIEAVPAAPDLRRGDPQRGPGVSADRDRPADESRYGGARR